MTPRLFGLAETDPETGLANPERVRIWGMEVDNRAIMFWRECGRNQFAVSDSIDSAVQQYGALFGLALVLP